MASQPGFGTAAAPIRVQVTGTVLDRVDGSVAMCPPWPQTAQGATSKQPPQCDQPVPVTGVDLNQLTMPDHLNGQRWGQTHVQANWDGHRLAVTAQRHPQTGDDPDALPPAGAPCAPPKDGWKLGPTQNDPGIAKIAKVVGVQFSTDWFAYPHGLPNAPGKKRTFELDGTEQVLVVAATGNLETVTAAVRSIFTGNLCVVRTTVTAVQTDQQATRLNQAIAAKWQQLGVISVGRADSATVRTLSAGQTSPSVSQVQVIVDTPELEQLLATIPGPPVLIDAWIRPL